MEHPQCIFPEAVVNKNGQKGQRQGKAKSRWASSLQSSRLLLNHLIYSLTASDRHFHWPQSSGFSRSWVS